MDISREDSPRLHDALLAWLNKQDLGVTATSVTGLSEEHYYSRGCDTCDYGSTETHTITVFYQTDLTKDPHRGWSGEVFHREGQFVTLLEELLES